MDDARPTAADPAAPPAGGSFDDPSTVPLDYEEWGPPDPDESALPASPELRHPREEIRRLGADYFDREIAAAVAGEPPDRFLAIDAEGRGWEIGDGAAEAKNALLRRIPDAQMWVRRVRPGPLYSFGGYSRVDR